MTLLKIRIFTQLFSIQFLFSDIISYITRYIGAERIDTVVNVDDFHTRRGAIAR